MPVSVYKNYSRTELICVVDNDGYVYDKADSPYNSTPRELYGHIDYNNRIYRGRDAYDKSYDKAGAVDYLGYVYNDMDMMCKATRIGYVQGSCIYDEGPTGDYPTTSPIAYMEGDGDMIKAGAAALVLVMRGSTESGDYYGGSTRSNRGAPPPKGGTGCAIALVVAVVLAIAFLCSDTFKEWNHSDSPRTTKSTSLRTTVPEAEGWLMIDDTHGRYRTSFMQEGAHATFTFTYTVGRDSKVTFKIDPDNRNLKTSARIYYNGGDYNIYYDVRASAGDQIVVVVTQESGTGYYNIHAYESVY